MSEEFKVTIAKKNFIAFFACFILIEAMLIAMLFTTEYRLLPAVLLIMITLIGIVAIFATGLFCVKVIGSTIKVRTRMGRKFEFQCGEITQVTCGKKDSTRYGPSFYITIKTKLNKVDIEGTMEGFTTMAGYLLDKHEVGEIKSTAITYSCQGKLLQYKNGEIFKRRKSGK